MQGRRLHHVARVGADEVFAVRADQYLHPPVVRVSFEGNSAHGSLRCVSNGRLEEKLNHHSLTGSVSLS